MVLTTSATMMLMSHILKKTYPGRLLKEEFQSTFILWKNVPFGKAQGGPVLLGLVPEGSTHTSLFLNILFP